MSFGMIKNAGAGCPLHYLASAVRSVKDVACALIAEEREVKLNEQLY